MNYLMLVCGEDAPLPPDAPAIEAGSIESWIELCGARRIYGEALAEPDTARTLRATDAEVTLTDGPFIEAKEFIGGFDLLACSDLDEAIELAAAHPVASRRLIELRPFSVGVSFDGVGEALRAADARPGERFMMAIAGDAADRQPDPRTWADGLGDPRRVLFAGGLQGPETATTVRVRSGATQLSDGPFTESEEFLAGVCVLDCADTEEALGLAASFSPAAPRAIEVRAFMHWGT